MPYTAEKVEMSTSVPIPKFTSFRPKKVNDDVGKSPKPEARIESGDLGGKERKHHHGHHRSRSKERRQKHIIEEKLPIPTSINAAKDLFVEDWQGDIQNLSYGSIHRYNIPAFHRVGAGSILGADPDLKIDRNVAEDRGIVLSNRRDVKKEEREKYAFARNEKKGSRLLRVRADLEEDGEAICNVDFIPFKNQRPRARRELSNAPEDFADEDEGHYRSIEGKAKVTAEPPGAGLEWVSDSDSSDPEGGRTIKFDEALRSQNIRLSRRVEEHPEDIEAWIDLINHQDSLLGLANEGHRKITAAERRSTADIKLHLYEKALTKAGSTLANRERLLLGMMSEGATVWDFKTQGERWERVSQDNLESVLLWKQYLDFRQCNFAAFRYEEVRDVFLRRIKLLKGAIEQGEKKGTNTRKLLEHLIYTILRVTLYMRGAGFSELAIATWQANLEFNFLAPTPALSSSSHLEKFQEFWDSEALRVGEEGAKGWRNTAEDAEAPDPKIDEEAGQEYMETEEIFSGWIVAEKMRAAASKMPARTLDETVEDDPYRVILWSDIENFLVDISQCSQSRNASHLLLDAFLIFCRLRPVPSSDEQISRQWWTDAFSRGEILDCKPDWITTYLLEENTIGTLPANRSSMISSAESAGALDKSNLTQWPFQQFAGSSETLFGPCYWFRYMTPWRSFYTSLGSGAFGKNENFKSERPLESLETTREPVPYDWLRNVLKILVEPIGNDMFTEYCLAFEFCNEPQNIKKLAKSLLKQNPQSIRLYNVYAMIEQARGNADISINVIKAALSMHTSLPQDQQDESIYLWRTWTWFLLDDRDFDGALNCLCNIAHGLPSNTGTFDASSPAALLKAIQHLSSHRDFWISSGVSPRAAVYTECLALLEYLSPSSEIGTSSHARVGDIQSALKVFENFTGVLLARGESSSLSSELTHQSAAKLLYHHAQSGPFRPALLRDTLAQSLDRFPQNTMFLSLYSWNESRLRIDDRVRTMLRSTILTDASDNVISRLFAIRQEMRTGNVYSTLAALENAVSSPKCRSNPGLWRFYTLFCVKTKELRRKAKDIFLRGVRACPWSKDLIMMAFVEIDGLGIEDKISIYKVLTEKELRIHVDVDDRIEEWYGKIAKSSGGKEEGFPQMVHKSRP